MKETWHILVSGKVQGVFYRQNTLLKATALRLNGWVKNLTDGRVEIFATGDQDNLAQLKEWCRDGSADAIVERVESTKQKLQEFESFEIRY